MRPLTRCRCLSAPARFCLSVKRSRAPARSQKIAKLRVYPGADADFLLYQDDGKTYAYEKGDTRITHLHWNEATQKLTYDGASAWTTPDSEILELIGR